MAPGVIHVEPVDRKYEGGSDRWNEQEFPAPALRKRADVIGELPRADA
jgi:hypothetical protein